jgi:hypothetical protein
MGKYHKATPGVPADFVLGFPIPITVVTGHVPIESTFEAVVIKSPDIKVSIPKGIH